NPVDERLVVNTDCPRAAAQRIAERNIQVAEQASVDRSLSHDVLSCRIRSLFRKHHSHFLSISRHLNLSTCCHVIWSIDVANSVQAETVRSGSNSVANVHLHIVLRLICGNKRNTYNENRNSYVSQMHSEIAPRLHSQLLPHSDWT